MRTGQHSAMLAGLMLASIILGGCKHSADPPAKSKSAGSQTTKSPAKADDSPKLVVQTDKGIEDSGMKLAELLDRVAKIDGPVQVEKGASGQHEGVDIYRTSRLVLTTKPLGDGRALLENVLCRWDAKNTTAAKADQLTHLCHALILKGRGVSDPQSKQILGATFLPGEFVLLVASGMLKGK